MLGRQAAVIAIFGPTAVGKTEVALELGDRLRARGERPVAISADALQVYEGLETLTGAASGAERRRLEHRLLDFVPVDQPFSVGEFMPLAHAEIDAALAAGRLPIVVGGTGLYLRAALTDLDLRPPPPAGLRERLEAELAGRGVAAMHAKLWQRAPALAEAVGPNDRTRILRSLELVEVGADGPLRAEDSQLWTAQTRHPTLLVGLEMERSTLYARVDARMERIAVAGARGEVRRAEQRGASLTARQALGFEELATGDVEALKRRARNLAKRQLTWMRKLGGATRIDVTGREPRDVAAEIERLALGA